MEFFWKDIPTIIGKSENILRIIVFIMLLIMSISFDTKLQKADLIIYLVGVILYFLSWVVQIYYPETMWSKSIFGFMAPAYITIIWFIGIGLVGTTSFFKIPYMSFIYISISTLFVLFHSLHAYIVYQRL